MRGYRLNPNKEYVDKIVAGILKKDGHCPCRVNSGESTLCPCEEFLTTGKCCCKLFISTED